MVEEQGTELRLALAMRGGVSLAVWIGGACAEIDAIRRAPQSNNPDDFWTALLKKSPYDRVAVDVMAGASAGGLNGVLFAASQVYDFPFDSIRDVWVNVGGIAGLVRRAGRDTEFPSLLLGDDYFQQQVNMKLTRLVSEAGSADAVAPPIDLRLSATMVEPIDRLVPSPADELLTERRFASGFNFRHSDLPWERSDLAAATDEGRELALYRLALAARSTSSFPAAFEAAFVRSGRPETFADTDAPTDLRNIFLDRRGRDEGFYVADGGILDNIPLGKALDAIADATADGRTRRLLMYLQPGAPARPVPPSDVEKNAPCEGSLADPLRRSTVSVVGGMVGARWGSETINADIDQLEAHNAAVLNAQSVRRGTHGRLAELSKPPDEGIDPATLPGTTVFDHLPPAVCLENERSRDYLMQRADEDARLVKSVLADPISVLGRDPFPGAVGAVSVPDDRWLSPLSGWTAAERIGLTEELRSRFVQREQSTALTHGVRPLRRVTELLLEWTRDVERRADDADQEVVAGAAAIVAQAGDTKACLYRTLAVVDAFLERPRRAAWVAAIAAWTEYRAPVHGAAGPQSPFDDGTVGDLLDDVIPAVNRVCEVESAEAALTWISTGSLTEAEERDLIGVLSAVMERVDAVATDVAQGNPLSPPVGTDLRTALIDHLVAIAEQLRATVAEGAVPDPAPDATHAPEALLRDVLEPDTIDAETLRRLEVLCFSEFATGLPGRRTIEFVRLSAASPTPLAPWFTALLDSAYGAPDQPALLWDSNEETRAEQKGIHVNLKLAGNELANFSAFLLEHWRKNDWMWGRLDAVPVLVTQIVTPEVIRQQFESATAAHEFYRGLAAPRTPAGPGAGIWAADAVETCLEELFLESGTATDAIDGFDISPLHDALIAARQWEIIRTELAEDPGTPITLDEAVLKVAEHAAGAETVKHNVKKPELVDRFVELGDAGTRAIVWNMANNDRFSANLPPWATRIMFCAAPKVVGYAAGRMLSSPDDESTPGRRFSRKLIVALAVAATVVAIVLGSALNLQAFLTGLVIGLAAVVPLVWISYWLLRRLIKQSTDAEPAKPERDRSHGERQPCPISPDRSAGEDCP